MTGHRPFVELLSDVQLTKAIEAAETMMRELSPFSPSIAELKERIVPLQTELTRRQRQAATHGAIKILREISVINDEEMYALAEESNRPRF